MRTWLARGGREWPVVIAVAGLLSLFLLPSAVRIAAASRDAESRQWESLQAELAASDPISSQRRLTSFLALHPGGPHEAEARRLLGRSTLACVRSGIFPGEAALRRAWSTFSAPPRDAGSAALRREAAGALAEYGLLPEAVGALRELADEGQDGSAVLDLVAALARWAGQEPDHRHALLDEASSRLSDFFKVASPALRIRGLLAQARIYQAADRDSELERLLAGEPGARTTAADRGWIHLARGRALSRLGKPREPEALSSFEEAQRLLDDPFARDLARIGEAELLAQAGNRLCLELCDQVASSASRAAPLGLLVGGTFQLGPARPAALEALRSGFARIRRPGLLDEASFDWERVVSAVRAAGERESDPGRLAGFLGIWEEVSRLEPVSVQVGFEHAALLLRLKRFSEAADRLEEAVESERARPPERARAVLAAADACAEGRLYRRAAALYRDFFALDPAAHPEGLYLRARSLRDAGDRAAAFSGFEEYLSHAGPGGTYAGRAILEEAELLHEEGRDEEALATYDRVLKAREVTTSPARHDWAQALLGRGRALVRLSRSPQARRTLEEYLERYGEGSAPAPASIEAARLLVTVAMLERRWESGLSALGRLEALAALIPEADRAPYRSALEEASALEGDLRFHLEDYPAAGRAYGRAILRSRDLEGRLRGLLGRARALARQKRKTEARQDYADAQAVFGEAPWSGPGREYWEIALDAVAEEVK